MDKITGVVYGIVAVLVMILMITTVVIPIVEDAQNTQTTTDDNESYNFMAVKSTDLSATITVSSGTITCNGATISENLKTILLADNFALYVPTAGVVTILDYENDVRGANVSTVTFSIVHGTMTYSYNSTDYSVDLAGDVYIGAATGSYGGFLYTNPFSIDKDKKVVIVRPMLTSSKYVDVQLEGTLDNLQVKKIWVWDNVNSEYNEFTGDANVVVSGYTLSDDGHTYVVSQDTTVTVTANIGGVDQTMALHGAASTAFAPIAYTVTEQGGVINSILGVLPLMLLIVPIMAVVAMFNARRN